MAPKSIKNRSKSSFQAFLFPHRFLHRFFIDFSSQLRPTGSPKSKFFLRKNMVFSKKRLSKITSISASILVPTCLHVGLQNRRFSEILAFQEAFKISSFFASIFYRFWACLGFQHGAILGAKTAQNPIKRLLTIFVELPKSGSGNEPAFEDRSRASWPRFWRGSGLDFQSFLDNLWNFLAYFGHVFACSLLPWFSVFLVRSSTNFAKEIQNLAED